MAQGRNRLGKRLGYQGMGSLHAWPPTQHKFESSFKRYAKRALAAAAE